MTSSIAISIVLGAAVLAVAAMAYCVFAWLVRAPEDSWLAMLARPALGAFLRVVHRLIVFPGGEFLPGTGPAILVANHRSGVDPVLLAVATRRRVRFLMAREYFETPGLAWAFRRLGCIPVNRDGNDLGATKAALKALRDGDVIGIFPQGGIREAEGSLEGKAGAALLCLRSGAPVVPCYIDGSPNLDSVFAALVTPSRSRVYCGVPLLFPLPAGRPARDDLENITAEIFAAIARLRPLFPGPGASEPLVPPQGGVHA